MANALFDAGPRRSRHGGTRALVHVPTGVGLPCPGCGHPAAGETTAMDALLRHGGYGASLVTTVVFCVAPQPDGEGLGCGWLLTKDVTELRPPRRRWIG